MRGDAGVHGDEDAHAHGDEYSYGYEGRGLRHVLVAVLVLVFVAVRVRVRVLLAATPNGLTATHPAVAFGPDSPPTRFRPPSAIIPLV